VKTLIVCLMAISCAVAAAEQRFKYDDSVDPISNESVRSVAVSDTTGKAALVFRAEKGKRPMMTLITSKTMFPDKVDAESKMMGINVTFRSNVMNEPKSGMFVMPWMDYSSAACFVSGSDTLRKKIAAADTVTLQLDKTGVRYTFPLSGDGFDGFDEALDKVSEVAVFGPAKN
jgi:hypothetical protein